MRPAAPGLLAAIEIQRAKHLRPHDGIHHTGDCFQRASLTMLEHYAWYGFDRGRMELVHATIKGPFDHAWCELEGEATWSDGSIKPCMMVIDETQPQEQARILPVPVYYPQVAPIENLMRFTFPQMLAVTQFFGHDGPWDARNPV